MLPPRIRSLLLLTALFACVAYFSYHGLYGKRGFFTHGSLRAEHSALSAELEDLRTERMRLEKRVSAMSPDSLDTDLLDEEVRRSFRYGGAEEIIVFEEMTR